MIYTLSGTLTFSVTADIEADTEQEARDALDSADCSLDCCDGDITITECCQDGFEEDYIECSAEKKWNDMTDRAE